MGATYTTAAERDARTGPATSGGRRGPAEAGLYEELLVVATSAVVALAILLAFAGRIGLLNATEAGRHDAAVINLNTIDEPAALDSALVPAFANPDDRRTAAANLSRFLTEHRGRREQLRNVGAIGRVLTASDVAALKPHFVVRTRGEFRTALFTWSVCRSG